MNAAEIVQVDSLDIMTTTSAAEKLCGAPEIEEEKREKQEQNKSCVLKEMSVLKENNSNQEEELDMSECISEKIEEHSDLLKQTMHAVGQNDHEVRTKHFSSIIPLDWSNFTLNIIVSVLILM